MSDELQAKLTKWLNEQGYPLEMQTASAFRKVGFRVVQSDYYKDPLTGTQREVDVFATIGEKVEECLVRISCVVECKSSKAKPWLLFCANEHRLGDVARVCQRLATDLGTSLLMTAGFKPDIQQLKMFDVDEPPAYGVTQAFTTGHDIAYAAICGAAAAAAAIVSDRDKTPLPICEIIFPVVVTDARLFSCVLKEDATLSLSEITRATLLWRNTLATGPAWRPHTVITIVNTDSLSTFCGELSDSIARFFDLVPEDAKDALANWKLNQMTKQSVSRS